MEVRKETKNLDYISIVVVRKSHYVSETLSKGSPLLWKKILKRKTLEPCPFRRIARGREKRDAHCHIAEFRSDARIQV